MSRVWNRWVVVGAVAAGWWLAPSSARAQDDVDWVDSNWRRDTPTRFETPQSWAFELRFGSYRPNIDDEFSASPGPYESAFGNDARLYFGIELDYQAFRIPWVGTIGPGASWGYTSMSANARETGTGAESAEETSLWIMPMYAAAVLRIDVLARETLIPLVPYGKFGLGYALWKTTNDRGTSDVEGVAGRGSSYGLYAAPGIMLQLDFLEPHAAQQLDNSVGINHSYAFFEWMYADLDGFGSGDQMLVGTSTWVIGLAFEM